MSFHPDVVYERLRPTFQKLEEERKILMAKYRSGKLLIGGLIVLGLILGCLFFGKNLTVAIICIVACLAGIIGVYAFFLQGSVDAYQTQFKANVFARIVGEFAPEVIHRPRECVDQSWFRRSGLFTRPDRYSGEDYFVGKIRDTELFFSEIHAEKEETDTDDDGHTSTHYKTIFKGIFFVADFHKEFQSHVTVTPDHLERFGFLGSKVQNMGGKVQQMENVEFEKLFCVKANDAVEARYILTPAMQERFVQLSKKWSSGLRVAFNDSLVYLALSTKGNWFDADLKKGASDQGQFRTLVSQLSVCLNIIEDLDLNTRIWTKK